MNKEQRMVKDFHEKFGCAIENKPRIPDEGTLFLRSRLINEEASEFLVAAQKGDLIDMVDALCDILYVVYGTAVSLGVDLEPIFAEVHRSNMTKSNEIGSDGKVKKENKEFVSPNIYKYIKKQMSGTDRPSCPYCESDDVSYIGPGMSYTGWKCVCGKVW